MIRINAFRVISNVCFAALVSGCISVSNSPTPRFYKLEAIHEDQVSKKRNVPANVLIGVGPVKIPEYLDRPQIVTQGKEKTLKFAQFDRWGEPLDLGLARLIRVNLTLMLPKAKLTLYPWDRSMPVNYQVVLEIVQLDSDLDKDLFLAAQWQVIDAQNTKTVIIKRSEIRQPIIPHDHLGLVKALSVACGSLSREIAEALAKLAGEP